MRYELHLGDCLDYLKTLEPGSVDAVITDPPYGIGFAAQPTKWQRGHGQKPRAWDADAPDVSFLLDVAPTVLVWERRQPLKHGPRCVPLSWVKL